ncbi:MAG: four helix bundle protein [Thermoanaerobaculia bacterium]
MPRGGYEDLIVWQKAIELVKNVYALTRHFPSDERFGLTSQMRRAAISIPSNIAEGHARHTTKEFVMFVSHAEGSAAELQTQVLIAIELGYCGADGSGIIEGQLFEIRKMLNALRRELNVRITRRLPRP